MHWEHGGIECEMDELDSLRMQYHVSRSATE